MKTLSDEELKMIVGGLSSQMTYSNVKNLNEDPKCICDYINAVASVTNENTVDSCKCRCVVDDKASYIQGQNQNLMLFTL